MSYRNRAPKRYSREELEHGVYNRSGGWKAIREAKNEAAQRDRRFSATRRQALLDDNARLIARHERFLARYAQRQRVAQKLLGGEHAN